MALTRRVELVPLERTSSGDALFSRVQSIDETLIANRIPDQPVSLFCHRRQSDQLILLIGSLEPVVLEDGRLVRIPSGVPHGAANSSRHDRSLRAQWHQLMGVPAPADPPQPAGAADLPSPGARGRK